MGTEDNEDYKYAVENAVVLFKQILEDAKNYGKVTPDSIFDIKLYIKGVEEYKKEKKDEVVD